MLFSIPQEATPSSSTEEKEEEKEETPVETVAVPVFEFKPPKEEEQKEEEQVVPEENEKFNRLALSEVSDRGLFSLQSVDDDFFLADELSTLLVEKPENRTDVLDLTIVQEGFVDEDDLLMIEFTWKVLNVTSNSIDFQLTFADAILVSNSDAIRHTVNVTIADNSTSFFVSTSGRRMLAVDQVLLGAIPAQNTLEESV